MGFSSFLQVYLFSSQNIGLTQATRIAMETNITILLGAGNEEMIGSTVWVSDCRVFRQAFPLIQNIITMHNIEQNYQPNLKTLVKYGN